MTPLAQISAAHSRLSANMRGALWMLASAFTFTLMTTLIKYLGAAYSPGLQTFYRQVAAVLVLMPVILRNPSVALKSNRPGILLYRSAVGTGATVLAFYAYQAMPLAEANALSFTRTLWVVPLAMFVLHERIGPWRLGATIIGFLGVLLMLQPAIAGAVGAPALAALASAALFATTIMGMKVMARDHGVLVLTTWSAILGLVFSIPLAITEWRWPAPIDLALLAAMGVCGLVNQLCYIKGMSIGEAAAMAPIDYMRLVFAVLVGFFAFHEMPNGLTMAGATVVIGSTLFITLREARLKKPLTMPADQ